MLILVSFVPFAYVLVSHCLRPNEGCFRTCKRKVKIKLVCPDNSAERTFVQNFLEFNARVSGKNLPVATVTEACEVVWCNEEVATVQVREALDSFVQELE